MDKNHKLSLRECSRPIRIRRVWIRQPDVERNACVIGIARKADRIGRRKAREVRHGGRHFVRVPKAYPNIIYVHQWASGNGGGTGSQGPGVQFPRSTHFYLPIGRGFLRPG